MSILVLGLSKVLTDKLSSQPCSEEEVIALKAQMDKILCIGGNNVELIISDHNNSTPTTLSSRRQLYGFTR